LLLLLLCLFFFLLLKVVFHIPSLRTWFPESVSATRISLLASSSSFIYFFWPLLDTHNRPALLRLLCMPRNGCRNVIPVRHERLLQWEQNRSKATMWLLYKIPPIRGCPKCCY
jgi:hypothetical protein